MVGQEDRGVEGKRLAFPGGLERSEKGGMIGWCEEHGLAVITLRHQVAEQARVWIRRCHGMGVGYLPGAS